MLLILTEETKFEAVDVTVAVAEEVEYFRALANKVHIIALHASTRPPHPTRNIRGNYETKGDRKKHQLVYVPFIS